MKLKRIITLICAQAMALSISSAVSANSADSFTDVRTTDYFYPAVEWGVENGITAGMDDTHFAPAGEVTRAQAVTFLWRMAGEPASENANTFTDVDDGIWYDSAVRWAVENKITDGTAEGVFSPDIVCDRAMCMTLLYRMSGAQLDETDKMDKIDPENEDLTLTDLGYLAIQQFIGMFRDGKVFTDVHEGDYYELPVIWGTMSGIVTADNTDIEEALFRPDKPCVRSEMISFLYQTKLMQDEANAPLLYGCGPITIAVPQEYNELLYRSITALGDDEDGIIITVSEKASRDAAEAEGGDPDEYGAGELFSIGRVSEDELNKMLSGDMSGAEVFAKDENGKYYIYYHPTDVRYMRETNEQMAADQEQWTELNGWAWNSVRDDIIKYSEGLTAVSVNESETIESGTNAAENNSMIGELHSSIQHETVSPEWVAKLPSAQKEDTTQLFVVAGMGMDKTTATVSMHEKDENGEWKQILSTPAYVGKNGLCLDEDHAEGCGQTPIGVYHFNKAFGIADDPGCAIPYIKVTDDTYWSGDMKEGMRYNEMIDIKDYPDLDMENSEHIVDYEYQYQYCLNISFNEDGTAGRGSAIFLHCLGPVKPYTGGCVALPENIMKMVMQRVHEDCVVVIDTLDNMGGSL